MTTTFSLVPASEGDNQMVKQTYFDLIKFDPVVTKAILRYIRLGMAEEVSVFMARLLEIRPEILAESQPIQDDYFDKVFDGRTFDISNSRLKL